jgi:formylglycine-generating enzyme required for sulfatase activity
MKYFDLWNGVELTPEIVDNHVYLDFPVESHGFGAILVTKSLEMNDSINNFLTNMHTLALKPLKSFSTTWEPLSQQMVAIKRTNPATKTPEGMVLIPYVNNFMFESKGVMIEGNELPTAIGVQHPWENHPARSQKHIMNIPSFYIDKYPVTNKEFKKFMDATHYHPKDDHNFLKDWKNGIFLLGWENKPVTWVSLEDASAYSDWAGKRLPHEWEWQYAAQGNDGRLYPWGNKMDSTKMPPADNSRVMRAPTNVNAFQPGASPFGVMDMVGNIWQWTDEYIDEHTRSAILKGGGYYRAATSGWYFPRAYELNKYGKYLLMAPGIDRAGTIGFRCAADL